MVKNSQYVELANDLEINKAITYLRQKDFNQVSVCVSTHPHPSHRQPETPRFVRYLSSSVARPYCFILLKQHRTDTTTSN